MLSAEGVEAGDQDALLAGLVAADPVGHVVLSGRERALVLYADKLTVTPSSVTRDDIQALRATGLDDRAIHDACAIVAYFAFVNRMADGLGVEVE